MRVVVRLSALALIFGEYSLRFAGPVNAENSGWVPYYVPPQSWQSYATGSVITSSNIRRPATMMASRYEEITIKIPLKINPVRLSMPVLSLKSSKSTLENIYSILIDPRQ